MKTTQSQANYSEWLGADNMHEVTKNWLSELKFIRDEHVFFEDLITTFTRHLIAKDKFQNSKEMIDAINTSQRRNDQLIATLKTHQNDLQIMVDGIDQLKKEAAYTKSHKNLVELIKDFQNEYKTLKAELFRIITKITKEEKQKRLIERK